jgi:uncharacterized membrane protein YbhN (UPF0104 family)
MDRLQRAPEAPVVAVYRTIDAMRGKLRRWWPVAKALLGLAILVLIARQFAADLGDPRLWARPMHLGWLALAGLLYLVGLSFSALVWGRLLAHPAPPFTVARAYFIGHLGKYVPGKAWTILLRAGLVRPAGVPLGMAGLTSVYEVLAMMASGALLAAVLFALCGTDVGAGLSWHALRQLARLQVPEEGVLSRPVAVALALLLAACTGLPLLPGLFNRVAHRLLRRFHEPDTPLPHIQLGALLESLALTGCGWVLLGASLWCALRAVVGALDWPAVALARLPAALAVAYVAGFVIFAPGGLGPREFFLALFLTPELTALANLEGTQARALVIASVVALRVAWTVAEVFLVTALYFVPTPSALAVRGSP